MIRFVKVPVTPAGPCKHCDRTTARLRGLVPLPREEKVGGPAGFTICPHCDGLMPAEPIR